MSKLLSEVLRAYIVADPIDHETNADPDRTFRVDRIAAHCQVSADTVREWALGKVEMTEAQRAKIVSALNADYEAWRPRAKKNKEA
jgi:hypothetical protein